jgi:hypothetical protein
MFNRLYVVGLAHRQVYVVVRVAKYDETVES